MAIEVQHNRDDHRYELMVDGRMVGVADYWTLDGTIVFPHTEIAADLRGRGLGEILVKAALEDVRSAARGTQNLLVPMREALRVRCTVGEICEVLRAEFGTYDAQRVA